MKYVIFILGLTIIALRAIGIHIDGLSIGLFVLISILVLLKNLDSLSEFSGFGIKLKINQGLKELSSKIDKVESGLLETNKREMGAVKSLEDSGIQKAHSSLENKVDGKFQERFKPGFKNPRLTLVETVIEMERVLKFISKQKLEKDNKYPISAKVIAERLYEDKTIDRELLDAFSDFWKLRNDLLHGVDENYGDNQIISLVESGLRILEVLRAIGNNVSKSL